MADTDGATGRDPLAAAVERNVAAQMRFVETWLDAVEESPATDPESLADGMAGYANAYEAWLRATEEALGRASDALEGDEVPVEEFRDIWLTTANDAMQELMRTTAFAAATGERVDGVLELQRRADEAAEGTLHALGVATEGDVEEVGARLVELERRQHAVESKLDRVLATLEADGPTAGEPGPDPA